MGANVSEIVQDLNEGVAPPIIHLWALDCEGCESAALETHDWDTTIVALLLVRASDDIRVDRKHEKELRKHGMKYWGNTPHGAHRIWYSPLYFGLPGRPLPTPPELTQRHRPDPTDPSTRRGREWDDRHMAIEFTETF